MSWNYRVIKHRKTSVDDEDYYGLYEVFYDDLGNVSMYSAEPCRFGSETLEGLAEVLKMAERALTDPVLNAKDLPGHNQ